MELILVGAFHEMVELCELCGHEIIGIFDNNLEGQYLGYKILGTDSETDLLRKYMKYPIVVTPDKPIIRKKLVDLYCTIGYKFCNLISPFAIISKTAKIGAGVVIQSYVNISSCTIISDFVKLNTCANVMHDVAIERFTTIAPNSVILGRVSIGQNSYVGANSTILPNLSIGNNSIIGAGSVVTKNIPDSVVSAGNPSKFMRYNTHD